MQRRGIINRIRGHIAHALGVSNDAAPDGKWWEVDLILVILGGALAIGIAAFIKL